MTISERTAAIVSGAALVIHGALKRGPVGALTVGAGGLITYFALRPTAEVVIDGRQVLRASHTVDAEPYDAFLHWQDLSQLPSVMGEFSSVKKMNTGNWRLTLPGGVGHMEVKLVHKQPGHVIEWRSIDSSKIDGRGLVRFTRKKNGRGTKIHMEFSYGKAGSNIKSNSSQPALQNTF